MKNLTIGLFGFGVVGQGIYELLNTAPQLNCRVKKVCIKDPTKPRQAPKELFTCNAEDILNDPEINVVVELISDAKAAQQICFRAFEENKHVVSANKKLIAEQLPELLDRSQLNNLSFLYEAACCASIPIIRNLEEYFDNDWLDGFYGIVNGSTNFILTQMAKNGLSYEDALKLASENGFAEADPSLDVEGYDAAYKLSILIYHAFGRYIKPHDLFRVGIKQISQDDVAYAKKNDCEIKLLALAQGDDEKSAFVCPSIIPNQLPIASAINEYNAVTVQSAFGTEQLFYGKGAGRFPTASAVLSDISALRYNYKYEYKKSKAIKTHIFSDQKEFTWFISSSQNQDLKSLDALSIELYTTPNYSYRIIKVKLDVVKLLRQNNPNLSILLLWEKQK